MNRPSSGASSSTKCVSKRPLLARTPERLDRMSEHMQEHMKAMEAMKEEPAIL